MYTLERVMREREREKERRREFNFSVVWCFNYLGKFPRVYNNIVPRISFAVIKGGK